MYPGMMYYGYGYSPLYGILGLVWNVVVIVAIIWAIVFVIRMLGGGHRGRRRWMWETHSALSILNERFAKGEIDKAEYEERRKALLGEETK